MMTWARWLAGKAAADDASRWLPWLAAFDGIVPGLRVERMLVPLVIVQERYVWRFVVLAVAGSVAGGLVAFLVGRLAWWWVGSGVFFALMGDYAVGLLQAVVQEGDVMLVLVGGLSPFPFVWLMVLMGFLQGNLIQVVVAAVMARGARFWLMAWLVWRHGPPMKDKLEKFGDIFFVFASLGLLFALGVLKYVAMEMA